MVKIMPMALLKYVQVLRYSTSLNMYSLALYSTSLNMYSLAFRYSETKRKHDLPNGYQDDFYIQKEGPVVNVF